MEFLIYITGSILALLIFSVSPSSHENDDSECSPVVNLVAKKLTCTSPMFPLHVPDQSSSECTCIYIVIAQTDWAFWYQPQAKGVRGREERRQGLGYVQYHHPVCGPNHIHAHSLLTVTLIQAVALWSCQGTTTTLESCNRNIYPRTQTFPLAHSDRTMRLALSSC